MTGFVQGIALTVSVLISVIVIELIRRNRLKERYSLIWLTTSFVLILFSASRPLLHRVAKVLGVYYPPSLIFIVAILFLLALLLHVSTVISHLSENNKRLSQEIGIMKKQLRAIEAEKRSSGTV